MKKLISVLLALVCLLSCVSVLALAADPIRDTLEEELGIETGEKKAYGIVYQKGGGNVKTMYMPATTVKFDGPGYAKVTADEPIAIDHNFRCWIDAEGNDVYPGDEIYVGTIVYLTADFTKKTDNNIYTTRVILCAFKTFIHMLEVALHIANTVTEFRPA